MSNKEIIELLEENNKAFKKWYSLASIEVEKDYCALMRVKNDRVINKLKQEVEVSIPNELDDSFCNPINQLTELFESFNPNKKA